MSTEKDVIEFNDALYSQYVGEPHEIQSHRRHSSNKPSIIINLLALALIATLGTFLFESGILNAPPRVEALDVPLIPNIPNTLALPTDQPPIVDSPRETDEKLSRSTQRKPKLISPQTTVANGQSKSKVERIISYALAQQGDRYKWGATGPNAFDCSGLVVAAFKTIGITLPHYTGDLLRRGIRISRASMHRGDLIFPTSGHVGIYLGGNKMVVASSGKGRVIIQTIYSFYTSRRIV